MKIGILGGGQLGRMLALAGVPLGLEFVFYDDKSDACAGAVGRVINGQFDDLEQLSRFAQQVDVVTLEFEHIPLGPYRALAEKVPVTPPPRAVGIAQDRYSEKALFHSLGIPTPLFYGIDCPELLAETMKRHGDTLVVKTRQFGYDGKGQRLLNSPKEAAAIWKELGGVALIAEQLMPFSREVSMIAARHRNGDIRYYPLTENHHREGILRKSRPTVSDPLQIKAENYVLRVMEALDYVGIMVMEFFDCDGDLVVNEIAPRVHNSGHWTIEGAVTSQFENHLRAVMNWPLGDCGAVADCTMYNIIGDMYEPRTFLNLPSAHIHDYGKSPQPGRKLGHVTLCNPAAEDISTMDRIMG